jgi:tetratricopeptide (TPR) repeat protein
VPDPAGGASPRTRAAELAAYQALNANRVDEAESDFKAILASAPQNPAALAGMGYVRMQQGNFAGAIGFLEQARQFNPDDKGLASALDTARFWFIMGEGRRALNDNDFTTAEKRYRAALDLRPDSADALEGLGGTLTKAQQPAAAIPFFQRAVAADPATAIAWRGLFIAQVQSGNAVLALATDKQIPAAVHTQLMSDPLYLSSLASAYSATGQTGDAQRTLEGALKLPVPSDAKGVKADTRLQLAALLASGNHLDQAEALYAQAVADDPGSVVAWQGLLRVQHALGHDPDAVKSLEGMPPASYATAMRDPAFASTVVSIYASQKKFDEAQQLLQKAIAQQSDGGQKPSPALQMQLADLYVQRGNPQLAFPVYQQIAHDHPDRADAWAGLVSTLHATGHDTQAADQIKTIPQPVRAQLETNAAYLETMASVYQTLGRSREAAPYLNRVEQDYAAESKAPPADVEIQNAWALYNGMEDEDLYRQLMDLGSRTDLTPDQRKSVQTIWTNWALRRAGQAVAADNPRRALAILNAAAQAFPDNPETIKQLAIGYAQAGQPHQAVLIYKAQNLSSASAADYQTAIGAALADGDNKDAEIWLRYALKAYPSDPQILMLGARFERARGDTARAISYYHASLKAMPSGAKPPAGPGLPAASAPAGLPSPNQPQDLVILLAPDTSDRPAPAPTPAPAASHQPYPSTGNSPVSPYGGTSNLVPPPPAGADTYAPYVAYIPPPPTAAPATVPDRGVTGRSVLPVQLGDKTPPPVPQQTDMTDVLPTQRYAPSARAAETAREQPEADAARIRQLRQDAAARTGQSHPPNDGAVTVTTFNADYTPAQLAQNQGAPQVPQPTTAPTGQFSNIPNTGAQQYPQPRTPPAPSSPATGTRTRPVPETPAPSPTGPAVAPPPAVVESTPIPPPPPASPAPAPNPVSIYPPLAPAYPLAPPPTDAELQAHNLPGLGGFFAGQAPIPMSPRQQAESELASLEGSYSGWLGATGIGRYRAGTPGLDRLYDAEAPVEASTVIGRFARLTAVAVPVVLDSGQLIPSSFTASYVPYLGTLPANAAVAPVRQYPYGVGGDLQLSTKDLGLAVGYTPYEFLVHNLTGRFHFSTLGDRLSLFGTREPVKDTELSYAGLRDPGAKSPGPIWGGVVATTGGVRLSLGSSSANFYLTASGGELTGRHVLTNTVLQGATGAGFRVGSWSSGSLTLGYTLAALHYLHDEVGLSYGQGGYFSPRYHLLAAIPVTLDGRYQANFHYAIAADLGGQAYVQEQAPFYPLDPALQAATFKPCTAAEIPSYNCGQYPRLQSILFNYSVNAEAAYRFAGHWYGGGYLSANNTRIYSTVSVGFFLRYVFSAQHSDDGFPTGLFHLQGLRPLQIP